jgi:hypothetical protein
MGYYISIRLLLSPVYKKIIFTTTYPQHVFIIKISPCDVNVIIYGVSASIMRSLG